MYMHMLRWRTRVRIPHLYNICIYTTSNVYNTLRVCECIVPLHDKNDIIVTRQRATTHSSVVCLWSPRASHTQPHTRAITFKHTLVRTHAKVRDLEFMCDAPARALGNVWRFLAAACASMCRLSLCR